MNCGDIRTLAPLYLSGEMEAEDRRWFAAHLAACPACDQEMEQQALLDERLEAVLRAAPDATLVEQRVRQQISNSQTRRRWMTTGAIAAGLVATMAGSYDLWRLTSVPRAFQDAARDHQAEVVDRRSRRWRSGAAEIESLAQQYGLSFAQAAALAPAGYSLDRAKTCGVDGQRMLHLVFSNGAQTYSMYVGGHRGGQQEVRTIHVSSEQVTSFDTGRHRGLVVTAGPAQECEELARVALARL